jgi:hypothetical protein
MCFPDASAEAATPALGIATYLFLGRRSRLELGRAFGAERYADCASHSEAATVVV